MGKSIGDALTELLNWPVYSYDEDQDLYIVASSNVYVCSPDSILECGREIVSITEDTGIDFEEISLDNNECGVKIHIQYLPKLQSMVEYMLWIKSTKIKLKKAIVTWCNLKLYSLNISSNQYTKYFKLTSENENIGMIVQNLLIPSGVNTFPSFKEIDLKFDEAEPLLGYMRIQGITI